MRLPNTHPIRHLVVSMLLVCPPAIAAAASAAVDGAVFARCDTLIAAGRYGEAAVAAQALLDSLAAGGEEDGAATMGALFRHLEAQFHQRGRPGPGCAAEVDRLLTLSRELAGPRSAAHARALFFSGQIAERSGDFAGARDAYAGSLEIREEARIPEDREFVFTLTDLANAKARLGEYDGLDPLYARALALAERIDGPRGSLVARILGNRAIGRKLVGDYDGARDLYERSLAIRIGLSGEETADVARIRYNIANLLAETGDLEGARDQYLRSLAVREKISGPEGTDVALTFTALALLEKKTADLSAARDHVERALAIFEAKLPPDHPRTVGARLTLASVLSDLGDLETAREEFERALPSVEKAYGADHHRTGEVVGELGMLRQLSGDLTGALENYERARRIYEAAAPDNDRVAAILNTEAALLAEMGRGDEGVALAERSVDIREREFGPDHPEFGVSLATLGACRLGAGDLAGAEDDLRLAHRLLADGWDPDHPLTLGAENDLARTLRLKDDAGEALSLALDVARGRRESLQWVLEAMPERLALTYADRWPRGMDLAITLALEEAPAPDAVARVWSELVRSRALVLDAMAARSRDAAHAADVAADTLHTALEAATRDLAGMLVAGWRNGGEAGSHARVVELRARCEDLESRLGAGDPHVAKHAVGGSVDLASVAAALPAGSALVGYASYDRVAADGAGAAIPSYAAFVLPAASRDPVAIDLGPADAIGRLVRVWRDEAGNGRDVPGRSVEAAEAACRRAGSALREHLWDPVTPALGDARCVYIVPDGNLDLVNFDALPLEGGRYLIDEERPLLVIDAERDLIDRPSPRSTPGALLALGAPDLTRNGAAVGQAALPASAEEVEEIAELWRRRPAGCGDVRALLGADASEAAFKTLAPSYGALHVATHGFFLDGSPAARAPGTRGVGGLEDESEEAPVAATESNPMLRSGLLLAGDADDAEDGVLTAAEIAVLDLSGADWVVLSACETGVGATRPGEGVFGLRRAFRIAGARDLVTSLWPLEDDLMRDWMLRLYAARLSGGLELPLAARQASRDILARRRAAGLDTNPHVWAAFLACGE